MVDSESVAECCEVAAGVTDVLVVDEACREREEPQCDSGADSAECARAVGLEAELAFAGPEHRLDPLADRPKRSVAAGLVLAVGAQEAGAEASHELLELLTREALVGDDGVALELHAGEHLGRHLALADVGGGELEGDRHAVRGAQQVEPKTPEVARMRAAVA